MALFVSTRVQSSSALGGKRPDHIFSTTPLTAKPSTAAYFSGQDNEKKENYNSLKAAKNAQIK